MNIMEDIEDNTKNGVLFIKVNDENLVTHTSEITKELVDGWIKIHWDYSMILVTIGDDRGLYDPVTNSVSIVDWLEFASNRLAVSKETKVSDISSLTVTTSTGKVFDGDETSQDRIVRAINIATTTGQTTTNWKLANNTIVEVTVDELKEALALSGQAMSDIWLAQ